MKLRTAIIVSCVALTACSGDSAPIAQLPADQVLQNAAQAAQKLSSAQYLATANFDVSSGNTWDAKGILRMDGTLQNSGEQIQAMSDLTVEVEDTLAGNYSLEGTVEVIVMGKEEVYLNVHTLNSRPDNAFFPPDVLRKLSGVWWLLPADDTPPTSAAISPDPRLLQAQAQVVTVTKEHGIVPFAGSNAYHYSVALNTEKLIAYLVALADEQGEEVDTEEIEEAFKDIEATGELWIDAANYNLHKITWDVAALQYAQDGSSDFDVTITMRNHNRAPPIEPPKAAKTFTPAVLFSLPTDLYFDDSALENSGYSEDALDELLNNFNSFE